MQILLAQEYGTRVVKAPDDEGIVGGNAIFEKRARGCGAHAGSVDEILEADRNTVKEPSPSARLYLVFR